MLLILDYGLGNLTSVKRAFKRLNMEIVISSSLEDVLKADKIVMPGVGHFSRGMDEIKNKGFLEPLNQFVKVEKKPILGICLGMQLMTSCSEESGTKGLDWIKSETKKINGGGLKVPHIGWNSLQIVNDNCKLVNGIDSSDSFYFVHSYAIQCYEENAIVTKTTYGDEFTSVFNKENIYGVQFHPEKSHDKGLVMIKNFISL